MFVSQLLVLRHTHNFLSCVVVSYLAPYWAIMLKYCVGVHVTRPIPANGCLSFSVLPKVLQGNASAVIQSWHVAPFYCQNKSASTLLSLFFNVNMTGAAKCYNYSMSAAGGGRREREKEINWGCLALLWWSCRVGTGPYGSAGHMEAEETCSSCYIQDYGYKYKRSVWLMELIC